MKMSWMVSVLVGLGCSALSSSAVLVTSNINQSTPAGNNVSNSDDWVAQKFVNGPSGVNLENVSARLILGGNVFVGIFSDSAGTPGTQLGLFDINPPLNAQPNINTFPYTGPTITLAPNTPYWIVVGATSPNLGSFFWRYTNGASTGPGSIPSVWAYTNSYNTGWNPQTSFAYSMEVNTVPEPTALTLVGLGALGLLRRR